MPREDSLFSFKIRFQRLDAALESSSKDNAVAARKHVKTPSDHRVIDFGLRYQYVKLAFDRHQLAVAEQLARAEAGGVDHSRLSQAGRWFRRREQCPANSPAGNVEISKQRVQVNRRLDEHH